MVEDATRRAYTNWCFTWNNPPDLPDGLGWSTDNVKTLVYQFESGSAGTKHVQGYVELKFRRTLSGVKSLLGADSVHFEPRRGTRKQAIQYCMKEDTRVEGTTPFVYGDVESAQGKRTDLSEFRLYTLNADSPISRSVLADAFADICAKFPRFVTQCLDDRRVRRRLFEQDRPVPDRPWQRDVIEIIEGPVDDRAVYWYCGRVGGEGKSYLAGYLRATKSAYLVTGGRHDSIFYGFYVSGCPRTVIFDWARGGEEAFPYRVIENFKNGYFLNTKYEAVPVDFEPCHVVVFANFMPDESQLSSDRWRIREI